MKPDWDKLMEEFKDSKTALVGDVDCTAAGEKLCSTHGVEGYPTIKHGDPNNLEKYEGGRTFEDMQKFAQENLGPTCSPGNLDLCDADKKAKIADLMKISEDDLKSQVKAKDDEIAKIEADFKEFVDGLQKEYETRNKQKDADTDAIKKAGLATMKQVMSHKRGANFWSIPP